MIYKTKEMKVWEEYILNWVYCQCFDLCYYGRNGA